MRRSRKRAKTPSGYYDKNGNPIPLEYFDNDVEPPGPVPESMPVPLRALQRADQVTKEIVVMGNVVALREAPQRQTPVRRPNAELRTREHLTRAEVDRLIEAAKGNRHGHRDATMILIAYRHGLRASELIDLRWDQVDFNAATLHVRRVKAGTPATHPLTGLEMRALRKLQRESKASPFVFLSDRKAPFSTAGFARMLERAAKSAGLKLKVHPHMLRHACGFKLANDGVDTRALQAYSGHQNIQHTVRYTELAPTQIQGVLARLRGPVWVCWSIAA